MARRQSKSKRGRGFRDTGPMLIKVGVIVMAAAVASFAIEAFVWLKTGHQWPGLIDVLGTPGEMPWGAVNKIIDIAVQIPPSLPIFLMGLSLAAVGLWVWDRTNGGVDRPRKERADLKGMDAA